MNKQQGDNCEALAILYYTSLGYIVSKPINHSSYYDLIVDDGKNLKKIECKSSRFKANNVSYRVNLKTCGGNSSWNGVVKKIDCSKVDEIFILDGDGYYYVFEARVLHNKNAIYVNESKPNCVGKFNLNNL